MSRYEPGAPSWYDLGSPDVAGSTRFYCDLFGWTATVAPEPEAGGYTTFGSDGRTVAAVAPHQITTPFHRDDNMPAIWTTYFATDDADAVTARVENAGGKVIMTPMDVMSLGRMAVFMDPAGAPFAVWQAGAMTGADATGEPGTPHWVELSTPDPEGAKGFYAAVFGYAADETPPGDSAYTVWRLGDRAVAGMMPAPDDAGQPHWLLYFAVADCDVVAARAADLGGSVTVPPTDIPTGRFALLADPHGAQFAVIRPDPGQ